jgi:glycosyltransferase involved in cell wall biosynthesis
MLPNRSTTIVVPTRNREELLPRALRSVLGQTYRELEVIVVDDASTDGTQAVVRSFADPRLRYVRHAEPRGAAAAKNTGLALAEGTYVSFLDDDDEYPPDRTAVLARCLDRSSDRMAFAYAKSEVLVDGRRSRVYPETAHSPLTFSEYLSGRRFNACCTLFRRTAIRSFDERLQLLVFSDLILRVLRDHDAVFVDAIALTYHDDRSRPRLTIDGRLQDALRLQAERHLPGASRSVRAGFYTWAGFCSMRDTSRRRFTSKCFARAFLLSPTPWNLTRYFASLGGSTWVERYQTGATTARRLSIRRISR